MFTKAVGQGATPGPASGFIGEFRFLADAQGLSSAAGRHPDADLLPVLQASREALRELVTGYGYTLFCTRGATTNLPTTAVEAGEQYAVINVGVSGSPGTIDTLQQVKRIDVKASGSDWFPLDEVTLNQLRDISGSQYGFGSNGTMPKGWCWLNAGALSNPQTGASVAGQIAIAPVPRAGQYCLWTMNKEPLATGATSLWLFHTEDWAQWMMWDAMSKIVGSRDKNSKKQLDYIVNNRLNREVPGSPAFNIWVQRPTAAGPRTWTRGKNYRGPWGH